MAPQVGKRSERKRQLVPLPVRASGEKPRESRRWRWRLLVLIGVHVAIALHIWHWYAKGRTLSPVEPSESMQTLEFGYVNAGFILFCFAILATLILGRFFCGWACHIVALQDVCGWVLRKLGLRPKPFRSRLLVWVPVVTALYMFVWPQVVRITEGRPFPRLANHLMTDDLWATFPTVGVGLLTFFVCGFLIVMLLGNKGFCTYGCPYGAFFYHADRFAVGKIRVTDACQGCGHCTATCTSNVRVHEEVRKYGMVVDAGCMKCMDCVDVCPNGALYWGIGKPSRGSKARADRVRPRPKYDFTLQEELVLGLLAVACFYAFYRLYDAVPLLLAVGLAVTTAYVIFVLAGLIYRRNVRILRVQAKRSGRLTGPGVFAAAFGVGLAWLVGYFVALQWHVKEGLYMLSQVQSLRASVPPEEWEPAAREALDHLRWASERTPFIVADWEFNIGSLLLALGKPGEALDHLYTAQKFTADRADSYLAIGDAELASMSAEKAEAAYRQAVRLAPTSVGARIKLSGALATQNKLDEAIREFGEAIRLGAHDPNDRSNFAFLLLRAGQRDEAIDVMRTVVKDAPNDARARFNFGMMLMDAGRSDEGLDEIEAGLSLDPALPGGRAAFLLRALDAGRAERAFLAGERWREERPFDHEILHAWATAAKVTGRLDRLCQELARRPAADTASWYALAFLYVERGERAAADSIYSVLLKRNPNLTRP